MPIIPFHDENPVERWPVVTVAIIVINVLILIFVQNQDGYEQRVIRATYGFIPARLALLNQRPSLKIPLFTDVELAQGVVLPPGGRLSVDLPLTATAVLWTPFTSLFLHAGWLHLLGNMWFLWLFGNNIEDRLGHFTYLIFYLVGGLLASTCHWLMTGQGLGALIPVIGASGAVAVILGAYAVTYPFSRIRTLIFIIVFFTIVDLPALFVLGAWFLMQMINAAHVVDMDMGGGVAWWAHIGGFAPGAAIMPFLAAGTPEPGHNWQREAKEQIEAELPPADWS